MKSNKQQRLTQSQQKQQFIDTAKEVEADESGEEFEKAFGKLVPPKTSQKIFGKPAGGKK